MGASAAQRSECGVKRHDDRFHPAGGATGLPVGYYAPMTASAPSAADAEPRRIGILSCLLGKKVRYDGGHKRVDFLTNILAQGERQAAALRELHERYGAEFISALRAIALPWRHANVPLHLTGIFKRDPDPAHFCRRCSGSSRTTGGAGALTLIRHHVRRLDVACVRVQTYLEPRPWELLPRNHF